MGEAHNYLRNQGSLKKAFSSPYYRSASGGFQ